MTVFGPGLGVVVDGGGVQFAMFNSINLGVQHVFSFEYVVSMSFHRTV